MTGLFTTNVIIAIVVNLVPQAMQIGAYAARYAGVTTRRIATAISLFSLLVTGSRLASLFMTPSLGALADQTANAATALHVRNHLHGPVVVSAEALHVYDLRMRLIVAASSAGILLGALLLPMFYRMFVRGIGAFERLGSIPRALLRLSDPAVIGSLLAELRPRKFALSDYPFRTIPVSLLVANTILFAVYSVGVIASYYASVIDIDARTTASGLSGLVNGVGTIAFALFIDPATAMIVDQTVRDERPKHDVAVMIFWLIVTAFLGTLLAQLILYPAAEYIAAIANFWTNSTHVKHI